MTTHESTISRIGDGTFCPELFDYEEAEVLSVTRNQDDSIAIREINANKKATQQP